MADYNKLPTTEEEFNQTFQQKAPSTLPEEYDPMGNENKYASLPTDEDSFKKAFAPPSSSITQTLMDNLEVFNRGVGRFAEQQIKWFAKATGLDRFEEAVDKYHADKEASANRARERNPWSTAVSGFVGEMVPYSLAYAGGAGLASKAATTAAKAVPGAAKFIQGLPAAEQAGVAALGKVGQGIVGGAVAGATDWADSEKERLQKTISYGALGGVAAGIGQLARVTAKASPELKESGIIMKTFRPKAAAERDLALNVKTTLGKEATEKMSKGDFSKISQSVQAANKAGVAVTPGQALGGEPLRSYERGMSIPGELKGKVAKVMSKQEKAVAEKVGGILDDIAPGENFKGLNISQSAGNAKINLRHMEVPENVVTKLRENTTIAHYLDKLSKNPKSTVNRLPDTNAKKLDAVRQAINKDLHYDAKGMPGKTLHPDEKEALKLAHKKLVKTMDDQFPGTYAAMRHDFQKDIIRKRWQGEISKISEKISQRPGERTAADYFKALFSGDKKTRFLEDLKTAAPTKEAGEEAVKHAQDVIKLVGQVKDSPLGKILSNSSNKLGSGRLAGLAGQQQGQVGVFERMITGLGEKRYTKAVLELMLDNNKWADKVTKVLKGDGHHARKFLRLVLKADEQLKRKAAQSKGFKGASRKTADFVARKGFVPAVASTRDKNNRKKRGYLP